MNRREERGRQVPWNRLPRWVKDAVGHAGRLLTWYEAEGVYYAYTSADRYYNMYERGRR